MIASINGIEIYYQKSGQGYPIVLLHGNSQDHTFFDDLVRRLADQCTAYAIDSRGHGKSSKVNKLSYFDMMEDIAAFIRGLNIDKPILLGSSDGAIVGLMLAYTYPDLLSALISCGANMYPAGLKKWFMTFIGIANRQMNDPKFSMMLNEPDIKAADLQKIQIPTLILAGSRDLVYDEHTKEMASLIPNSKCVILRGQTHTSYIKNSRKLCDVMLPFLNNRSNLI